MGFKEGIRHICFDKDGVLLDVHMYWAYIAQKRSLKAVEHFKIDSSYTKDLARAMGVDLDTMRIIPPGPIGYKPRNVVVQAAVDCLGRLGVNVSTEMINGLFAQVDQQMQKDGDYSIRMLPGADKALKDLKELGYRITLFSSDRKNNMQKNFKALAVDHLIDAYVGGDEVQKSKPDPEGFLLACQHIGVPVNQSIYVGDTKDDMCVAKTSGCLGGYGLTTGLCSAEELKETANGVFNSLGEFVQCLRKAKNNFIMQQ